MRISEWATGFNIEIIRFAGGQPGDVVYRLIDLFTTRDGSWEPSNVPGSVPQWARDAYLKPPSHPQYNDDGGADHHLFGAVRQEDGTLTPFFPIKFWTHADDANRTVQQAKRHGWANIVMYSSSSFVPERGERGPWAWQPASVNADVVVGGGMPSNWHVSWFAVWEPQVIVDGEKPPVDDGGTELAAQVAANTADIDELRRVLKQAMATMSTWTGD